jgi:hypothetical protein
VARSPQVLVELLNTKIVVALDDIRASLDDASRATAFRYLVQIPYRRSYNHNARYYTLHEPKKYDRYGLWSYKEIHFSRDGALNRTVQRLVTESQAGWTQAELQQLLRVRVQSLLRLAVQEGHIERQKISGLYIYFHADRQVQTVQMQFRKERIESEQIVASDTNLESIPNDAIAIQVLLTLIRHPGSNPGQVVRRLRGHSPPIKLQQVTAIFTRYNLGEKGGCTIC